MKTTILNLVLFAGLTITGQVVAHEQQSTAARDVRELDVLASEMANEYRIALRQYHHGDHICPSEARLMEALTGLDDSTSHLQRDFDHCAEASHLREELCAVKRTFACVERAASQADAPRCLTRLMDRFEESLECLEHSGFGGNAVERPRHIEESCRPVRPFEALPSIIFELQHVFRR
jgi:hypothetical protein